MTPTLFDQFMSPTLFGTPLILLALTLPWLFFPIPSTRWIHARLLSLQAWLINRFTNQIITPLNLEGHKWAALFASLMFFIVTLNTLGLLPYTFTPTTQLSMNLGLAVPLWLAAVLIGLRNQPTIATAHFLPEGTPSYLIPILIIIETISLFIRPLALGVRLTANLTAGHLLIHLVSAATLVLMSSMPMLALMSGSLLFLLSVLEIAVAAIQAYVFVLLLALYLQENV